MRSLAAALLLIATLPVFATPTDFSFKDVEVQSICQTIAVLGKFNVIVDPGLSRMRLTFSVRQVEPLDALADVARQAGGQVIRVRHEEGTVTATFMVARPEEVQKQGKVTRTIQLKYASAVSVARTLGERIEAFTGSKASIDERTNRIVLTGTEDGIERVYQLLRDFDLPVPAADIVLTLSAGAPGKTLPVWSGTASLSQGKVGRVQLGISGGLKAPSWKLAGLEGKLQFRCNADSYMAVGLNVHAALEKDGIKHAVSWATEVQVQSDKEVLVGTVEVAPNEVITLQIRPVVVKGEPVPACSGDQPAPPQGGDLDLEGI